MADYRPKMVPISRLRLDLINPRLHRNPAANEAEARQDLITEQPAKARAKASDKGVQHFMSLAAHMADHGMDPAETLMVMPIEGSKDFTVLEGNRRTAVLQALRDPRLVRSILSVGRYNRLMQLSERFKARGETRVSAIVFDSRKDADPWIRIRHEGFRNGIGRKAWSAREKQRFHEARGKGTWTFQLLNWLVERGAITEEDKNQVLPSVWDRIVQSSDMQSAIGFSRDADGALQFGPSAAQAAARLARIVELHVHEGISTPDIMTSDDRALSLLPEIEAITVSSGDSPDGRDEERSAQHYSDDESKPVETSGTAPRESTGQATGMPTSSPKQASRNRIAGPTWAKRPGHRRDAVIAKELTELPVGRYKNAGAVLMRTFVEISITAYEDRFGMGKAGENEQKGIEKRLKAVASHMKADGILDEAAYKAALMTTGKTSLEILSMHQWIHNQHTPPTTDAIYAVWDSVEPLLKALWKRIDGQ